jgi:hypothetical protein
MRRQLPVNQEITLKEDIGQISQDGIFYLLLADRFTFIEMSIGDRRFVAG